MVFFAIDMVTLNLPDPWGNSRPPPHILQLLAFRR